MASACANSIHNGRKPPESNEGLSAAILDGSICGCTRISLTTRTVAALENCHDWQLTIPTTMCCVRIFSPDRYAETRPPFSTGDKKHEFPDAFALESIRYWAIGQSRKVYVASQDTGMKEYCDEVAELVFIQTVDQFLDIAIREDQEAASKLRAVIDANQDSIEAFIEAEFPSLGFFVDDREGDVNDVSVSDIEIHAMSIVKLDGGIATVELDLTIKFVADVSYDDIEHGIYDSETKSLWTQQETGEWEREYYGSAVISVSQDEADPTKLVVKSFQINDGEDIALSYDDGWPYK
ncbi:MAG: hypothetical protein KDB22_27390 [Planctomycetales bacterium]|nr:hypothetical protein [Planctomycetales bacterium]